MDRHISTSRTLHRLLPQNHQSFDRLRIKLNLLKIQPSTIKNRELEISEEESRLYPSQIFQRNIAKKLEEEFLDILQRAIPENILDLPENKPLIKYESQMRMEPIYSPTCDVAVGPFSFRPGCNYNNIYLSLAGLHQIKRFIASIKEASLTFADDVDPLSYNNNPRCFLSIEVENRTAKDIKHLLGSITNCSLMGKIGVVIVFDDYIDYAKRLLKYISFVEQDAKKLDEKLFRNIFVIRKSDLSNILQIRE